MQNLRAEKMLSLESLCDIDLLDLQELIAPSGLFKSKAHYIKTLALAIKEEFGDFESFCLRVERSWLLKQKGIGPETADSILCYACQREEMVVDTYTARLLTAFGYNHESYNDLKAWCSEGLCLHFANAKCAEVYALFHGMIVEFVKQHSKEKKINIESLR